MSFTIYLVIIFVLLILLILFWLQLKKWLAYKIAMLQYIADYEQYIADNCSECDQTGVGAPPESPTWPSGS